MVLCDLDILQMMTEGVFDKAFISNINPASIDLALGEEIRDVDGNLIDKLGKNDEFVIKPNQFVLAHTLERINMPINLLGIVKGKSSLARKGLIVEFAGFIDPGFTGQITLELKNVSDKPVTLKKYMRICQLCFLKMDQTPRYPYGSDEDSHYQHQMGAVASRNDCFVDIDEKTAIDVEIHDHRDKDEYGTFKVKDISFKGSGEESKNSFVEQIDRMEQIDRIIKKILGEDDD